ncbi:MAG: hypothetical protein RJQ08_04315 [Salinisphaeraceae bacterium]
MSDGHRATIVALVIATAIGATRAILTTVFGVIVARGITMLHSGMAMHFIVASRRNSRPRATHMACQHQ